MADLPVSGFPAATSVASADVVPIVQSGTTKRATVAQILANASTGTGTSATYSNIVNVKNYGALGDGSTDDTTAVKNAIAACKARTGGAGIVYFPLGVYIMNQALVIPNNIMLEGEHQSASQIRLYTNVGSTPFLTFGAASQINTFGGIRRMQVDAETNSPNCCYFYGPQEGCEVSECLMQNATADVISVNSQGMAGGSNKFVIQRCWLWVAQSGRSGIYLGAGAGPLTIKDTTCVGINRPNNNNNNPGGPTGSAGIVAVNSLLTIDNVNVELFESALWADKCNLDVRDMTGFFNTWGVTLGPNSNDGPVLISNCNFDNVTACLRNLNNNTTVGYFHNYRGEMYTSDQRSFDQNWWAYGMQGIYGSSSNQGQLGYAVNGNSDTSRLKLNSIQAGGSWTEVANVDSTNTFGTQGSAYNGQHLRLGSYHLWIDSSGRLRVKSSTPTSDTDGTVVGAQS